MVVVIDVPHGRKSYDIVFYLFRLIGLPRKVSVLDLTFGMGRFYRRLAKYYDLRLIGVDVVKQEWEVEPTVFYEMDMRDFVDKVISNEIELGNIDVVVVDPPWSAEKRGRFPRAIGVSNMPYHIKNTNSKELIQYALKLQHHLGKPLIYRYKEPINGSNIVVRHHVKIIRNKGIIYYGVLGAKNPIDLYKYLFSGRNI